MARLMTTALVLIPAGASARDRWAAGACASGCGVSSTVLMAATAALGVWVLRSAEKDGGWVKRAGQAVGWTLAVVGLGGFLCGAASYGLKRMDQGCRTPAGAASMALPPGHPPLVPGGS
ncbi:MAG: hypothetical protein HYV14_13205 [Elusimicrobia bacterium]|nr:hypothetical protein [Elusimicrobiota bacterium]